MYIGSAYFEREIRGSFFCANVCAADVGEYLRLVCADPHMETI